MKIYKIGNVYKALINDKEHGGGYISTGRTAYEAIINALWIAKDNGMKININ